MYIEDFDKSYYSPYAPIIMQICASRIALYMNWLIFTRNWIVAAINFECK